LGAPHLVGVEDEVKLAHVLKHVVERLDKHVDEVQDAELRLRAVDDKDKVQRSVYPVHQLGVFRPGANVLEEVTHAIRALRDQREALANHGLLAIHRLPTNIIGVR
jgi:hypothetical protein